MTTHTHDDPELEKLFKESAQAFAPRPELKAALRDRLRAALATPLSPAGTGESTRWSLVRKGIQAMKRTSRIAAAAVAAAAVVVAVLLIGNGGATVAWGAAQEKIAGARTVSWKATISMHGKTLKISEFLYREPGSMRESSQAPAGAPGAVITHVYDFTQGKGLRMNSWRKTATFLDYSRITPKAVSIMMNLGWQLKKMFESDGRPLGEKQIDGRQVKGFQVSYAGLLWDVWLDATTGDPCMIEYWNPSGVSIVMKDFAFDRELDDSLFSLSPLKGYAVDKKVSFAAPLPKPMEADMTDGLRFLARHNDKTFPLHPGLTPQIVRNLKKKAKLARRQPEAHTVPADSPKNFHRMILFLYCHDIDWHYVGGGGKLGDGDAAIFRYLPKGSKVRRVIYGDLSIREVLSKDLPRASGAAE